MIFSSSPARWIAGFLVLVFAAMALANVPLLVAGTCLLSVALVAAALPPPAGVRVERSLSRSICWVGDAVEVRRSVTVDSGIGPVFVRDALAPEMVLQSNNNYRVLWKWPGTRTYDLSYTVGCPKRGEFFLTETEWEVEPAAFSRGRLRGHAGGELSLAVVPRLQGAQRLAHARAKAVSPFPNADRARMGVSTTDFQEIRAYAPGDPIRTINWKASARASSGVPTLLTNKYEPEGRRAVWLFIDGGSHMEVGSSLSNAFEQALEAASAIGHFYLTHGFTLGASVFNNSSRILTPDVGQKQFRRLTRKLLTLSTEPQQQGLNAAIEWGRHHLVRLQPQMIVITRLDALYSPPKDGKESWDSLLWNSLQEGLRRLVLGGRRRGAPPVWLLNVGGRGYLDRRDVYEAATSSLLYWETLPFARQLRRAGVSVLDWDPSAESFSVVLQRHLRMSKVLA